MSKLYNAISRLDEIALSEEQHSTTPENPFQHTLDQSGSSLSRILILCGALILFGVVAIGTTAWWQNWLPINSTMPGPATTSGKTEENTSSPVAVALPTPPTSEIAHQPLANRPNPAVPELLDRPKSTADGPTYNAPVTVIHRLPAKAVKRIPQMIKTQPVHADVTTEPQPLQISEETKSLPTGEFIEQTAQLSRWLHQAEQRRKAGDWDGAIVLFKEVWQISENPAVANNLAASLIQLNRLAEAREILAKALQKTPKDRDLKQNLRLIQQLMHN